MNTTPQPLKVRDHYIDFLRGFGLLLLVIAHTWAPEPLRIIRSFDVPLMVFISAICYKPTQGTYFTYFYKRLVRIYKPVLIFLSIFFIITSIIAHCGDSIFQSTIINKYIERLNYPFSKIIGSYLLLNTPSIGYVWIMRVFLLIALTLPLIYSLIRKLKFTHTILLITALCVIQPILIYLISLITSPSLNLILNQTILYIVGYSPFVILGIKVKEWTSNQLYITIAITVFVIISFYLFTGIYDPQLSKYPPHSLYIFYGIFGCVGMWSLKPFLDSMTNHKIWAYFSRNSMWLYLWHIIPIIIITPHILRPHLWIMRYLIVLGGAILLNWIYDYISCLVYNLLCSIKSKQV